MPPAPHQAKEPASHEKVLPVPKPPAALDHYKSAQPTISPTVLQTASQSHRRNTGGLAGKAVRAEETKVDKSGYTLFNPTPESALRDFAPDRPANGTGPTTVDAGHILLEVELFNYSRLRSASTHSDTWTGPNPTACLGVADRIELQLTWAPYLHQRSRDLASGDVTSGQGPGDLFVRGKFNLWGNDDRACSHFIYQGRHRTGKCRR